MPGSLVKPISSISIGILRKTTPFSPFLGAPQLMYYQFGYYLCQAGVAAYNQIQYSLMEFNEILYL
jgi:hypothetical protein